MWFALLWWPGTQHTISSRDDYIRKFGIYIIKGLWPSCPNTKQPNNRSPGGLWSTSHGLGLTALVARRGSCGGGTACVGLAGLTQDWQGSSRAGGIHGGQGVLGVPQLTQGGSEVPPVWWVWVSCNFVLWASSNMVKSRKDAYINTYLTYSNTPSFIQEIWSICTLLFTKLHSEAQKHNRKLSPFLFMFQ